MIATTKLVRYENNKTITETIHLGGDTLCSTKLYARAELCGHRMPEIQITGEDIGRIYNEKYEKMKKEFEEKQEKQENEKQEDLKELAVWKMEMQGKTFFQQVAALWRLRKR